MAKLLIVDDDPVNRELLHAYLEPLGFDLIDATDGNQALQVVAEQHPDLVLLDVLMPGLDGFAVTERIKADAHDASLPVVLITALGDRDSRVRGLRAGADEFLSKPVDRQELILRVGHLLELRHKERALVSRNVELAELHRFREEVSAMLVHDLKNPLSVMLANAEYLVDHGGARGEALDAALDMRSAGKRALRLLENLADVSRIEAGALRLRRQPTDVAPLVEPLVTQRAHMAEARAIRVGCGIDRTARILADGDMIVRVVENVLDNAFRHTPAGGRIEIAAQPLERVVELRIGNSGAPIPVAERERIFEKFSQAGGNVGRMNLGLGLYFCRLATEAHGGRIWVEETPELPTVFGLELPA